MFPAYKKILNREVTLIQVYLNFSTIAAVTSEVWKPSFGMIAGLPGFHRLHAVPGYQTGMTIGVGTLAESRLRIL